jgi:enoyl-CoA hydratase/carnithine racemase
MRPHSPAASSAVAVPTLLEQQVGGCLILTISNPSHKNALDPAIYAQGLKSIQAAQVNQTVRAVVITGADSTFCAGGNLHRLQANRTQAPNVQADSIDALHAWIMSIQGCKKPVIAAVEGAAAGAGFSLALACDFLVAANNAVFRMAYSPVGLSTDGGATWSLTRKLPANLALEHLCLGSTIKAPVLHTAGVINRLCDSGQALAEALALAESLAKLAPNVLADIKLLAQQAAGPIPKSHLDAERDAFVRNLHHTNGGEGIAAFLGKRPPQFVA